MPQWFSSWPCGPSFVSSAHHTALYRLDTNKTIAGLVGTVNAYDGPQYQSWIRLYNLTFLVGVFWSFAMFWGLNIIFPVKGLGEETPFEGGDIVLGVETPDGISEDGKMKVEV